MFKVGDGIGVFFNDLTEEAQDELMEYYGISDIENVKKEFNWDIVPLFVLNTPKGDNNA